jgi:hypothetical protein
VYYSFLIYKNKTLSKTSRLSSSRAPLTLLAYRWVLYMCLRFTIKMDFDMKRWLERSMQPMVILITRQLLTRRDDRHVEHNCINMMVLRIKFRSLWKKKRERKIAYKRRRKIDLKSNHRLVSYDSLLCSNHGYPQVRSPLLLRCCCSGR